MLVNLTSLTCLIELDDAALSISTEILTILAKINLF